MRGSERQVRAALLLLIVVTVLFSCFYGNEATYCIESEKQALLTFKQDLTDPANRLGSWIDGLDCCEWSGVVCNNDTGRVTELRLGNPYERNNSALGGRLNPSLLHLQQLQVLNLSWNNFGAPIPSFIGSISSLQHLYLSGAGFRGIIPHQLGNLTNLLTLRVGDKFDSTLVVDNLQWLASLSNLESLDMTFVNLSEASNWLQVINMIPSLQELHLSRCDLPLIPHLINFNLSSLAILDLSYNRFMSLPRWIFGLRKLLSLDLRYNDLKGPLPEGPWNLTSLNHLDLSANWLYGSLPRELFNLNNLISLSLSENHFNNHIPNARSNLTNLQNLDLSYNNLSSSIPNWLYNCKHLKSLHLEDNHLQGAIQKDIGNLSSLVDLDLCANELGGTIPTTIGKLCNIKSLLLCENKLEGLVSNVIDAMAAGCFSYAIQNMDLGGNQLSGQLPDKLEQFRNLLWFDLGVNSISGPIPQSVGLLSSLDTLILRENKLNGTLPHTLGQLSKLVKLDVRFNMMEGIVSENLFENLTSLRYIRASGNSLTFQADQNWVPPTQFIELHLSSWKLGPQFPTWFRSQKEITDLDLSNTGISGAIPSWIWDMELIYLNLSHNHFQGEISIVCCITFVDLSSNQFSGELPHLAFNHTYPFRNVAQLDLSNNSFSVPLSRFLCDQVNETQDMRVEVLNLGRNLLSGEIPDCWMNWLSITAINLANNNLTGTIPRSIGHLKELQFLHLRNNRLSGGIPSSLKNCTMLQTIDLADNNLDGSIPIWLGLSFLDLGILILRSNRFQGELTQELCHLTSLRILDVSNNNFSGEIPRCFKNFTSMADYKKDYYIGGAAILGPTGLLSTTSYTESDNLATKGNEYDYDILLPYFSSIDLSNNNFSGKIPDELTFLVGLKSLNLSGNQLGGMIPEYIGKMVQLESLDLSRNQLSGQIPSSMSQVSFLGFLNLSYNNLSGEIPLGTQMQSFNASCFVGNKLCGPPLTKNCSSKTGVLTAIKEGTLESGEAWFYAFMGLGYVVGFWGVCFTLIFKKRWRYAYFRFVDEAGFKVYYFLCTKFCSRDS